MQNNIATKKEVVCLTKEKAKIGEKRLVHFIEEVVRQLAHYRISFEILFCRNQERPNLITSILIRCLQEEILKIPDLCSSTPLLKMKEMAETNTEVGVMAEDPNFKIICHYLDGIREIGYRFSIEEVFASAGV